MQDALRVQVRQYFSFILHPAAVRQARNCREIEGQFNNQYDAELDLQLATSSISAIQLSVSFLESTINELFRDANDTPNAQHFSAISPASVANLAEYVSNRPTWNTYKRTKNAAYVVAGTYGNEILNKYQFACVQIGHSELTESDPIFTATRLLIDFRNKLSHFEPETVAVFDSEGPVPTPILTQRLDGQFAVNPFARQAGATWFPNIFLGFGAAEWAIKTSLNFADDFFNHVSLPIPYATIRQLP